MPLWWELWKVRNDPRLKDINLDLREPVMAPPPVSQEDAPVPAQYVAIAQQIIDEIKAQQIQLGRDYTEEEVAVLMKVRSQQLANDYVREMRAEDRQWQALQQNNELLTAIQEMAVMVERAQANSPGAKAMDFWRSHPFLTGFLGADVVHRVKKMAQGQ